MTDSFFILTDNQLIFFHPQETIYYQDLIEDIKMECKFACHSESRTYLKVIFPMN